MSFPRSVSDMPPETAPDPELVALPKPPQRARTVSLVLMGLTTLVALAMVWALAGEIRYAWTPGEPKPVGELSALHLDESLADAFVHGTGQLDAKAQARYERFLEVDDFLVAQVVGNERLWVELRQPKEGHAAQLPTSFVGRLVPMASAGLTYRGLAERIEEETKMQVPPDAWLLVEGATPGSSRWAIALAGVLTVFAGWNLTQLVRLTRRVRD